MARAGETGADPKEDEWELERLVIHTLEKRMFSSEEGVRSSQEQRRLVHSKGSRGRARISGHMLWGSPEGVSTRTGKDVKSSPAQKARARRQR